MNTTVLVTGGAGFIASNFILQQMERESASIVNLDKLTYAANVRNLESVSANPRYEFVHGGIGHRALIGRLLDQRRPSSIVHLAAESHVGYSNWTAWQAAKFIGIQKLHDYSPLVAAQMYYSLVGRDIEHEVVRF